MPTDGKAPGAPGRFRQSARQAVGGGKGQPREVAMAKIVCIRPPKVIRLVLRLLKGKKG